MSKVGSEDALASITGCQPLTAIDELDSLTIDDLNSLESGTGVSPVNHARAARATIKPHQGGGRSLTVFAAALYHRFLQAERSNERCGE